MPESFDLSFSFNAIYFFLAIIILAGYAYYVYRYTIPQIAPAKKILLVALRSLALILILFIIFEPIITAAEKIILEPVNLIFIDNSRSIKIEDGTNRIETVNNFISDASTANNDINAEFYSFGNKLTKLHEDSLNLNFEEGVTNFAEIFSDLTSQEKNISSIVIISDGAATAGSNPVFTAEKFGVPVYTIGVGDSSKRNDIEIRGVLYSEYIYAETPTTINVSIINNGFDGKTETVTLLENDVQVDQQNITLSSSGAQNINFEYTPKSAGEKKLSVRITNEEGEFTYENNRKAFYINVLSNKIKVLVVSGSPSPDLTFIKNSLKKDPNLSVNSITQIAADKYLENNNRDGLIDSAEIFYLIGFPSRTTTNEFLRKIVNAILSKNKPFFISLADGTDLNKLKEMEGILPFTIGKILPGYSEVQPHIPLIQSTNPLLQNNANEPLTAWNNLPPVLQPNTEINSRAESEVLAITKINNIPVNRPLVLSRKIGSKSSLAVLAKDIWRWKLQTSTKNLNLFDNFIGQSVKWLNTSEDQKQVTIKTSKKLYSPGEEVEFSAQVYDETFNPVSDAEVKIKISSNDDNYELTLNSIGSGLYEGKFQAGKSGDYSFTGSAKLQEKTLGSDDGRFNIGEVDIEMINPVMDYEFLNLLANRTGGKFFMGNDYRNLFSILKERNNQNSKEKIKVSEIELWSNEWLLALAILLFAIEWFIRKRSGML